MSFNEENISLFASQIEPILKELVYGKNQIERLITLQVCLSEGTNEGYDYVIDLLKQKSDDLHSNGQFDCKIAFLINELYVLKA